jgi:hypothetical protein
MPSAFPQLDPCDHQPYMAGDATVTSSFSGVPSCSWRSSQVYLAVRYVLGDLTWMFGLSRHMYLGTHIYLGVTTLSRFTVVGTSEGA